MYIEDFEKKFRLVVKHVTELNELYNKLYKYKKQQHFK
jgi:hypothetical protein